MLRRGSTRHGLFLVRLRRRHSVSILGHGSDRRVHVDIVADSRRAPAGKERRWRRVHPPFLAAPRRPLAVLPRLQIERTEEAFPVRRCSKFHVHATVFRYVLEVIQARHCGQEARRRVCGDGPLPSGCGRSIALADLADDLGFSFDFAIDRCTFFDQLSADATELS